MRRFDFWKDKINIIQIIDHSLRLLEFVNRVRWRTNFIFLFYRSSCSVWFWFVFPKTETIRSRKSRAEYHHFSILHPKKWFLILLIFTKTEVCFLHIELFGTNVWFPKTHNVPPEVDFEFLWSPAKSESWNSHSLHFLAVLQTLQYGLYSHVWWTWDIKQLDSLSQVSVNFVIDRASLLTDDRIIISSNTC